MAAEAGLCHLDCSSTKGKTRSIVSKKKSFISRSVPVQIRLHVLCQPVCAAVWDQIYYKKERGSSKGSLARKIWVYNINLKSSK